MSDDETKPGHIVNDRRKRTPMIHQGPGANDGQEDFEKRQAEEAERQKVDPNQLQFPGMEDEPEANPEPEPGNQEGYDITPPDTIPCHAAFIVYQDPTGKWLATSDIKAVYEVQTVANLSLMLHGCSEVLSDIQVLNTTQMIVNAQQQTAQMMMEQQKNAALAQRLAQEGINLPPRRG